MGSLAVPDCHLKARRERKRKRDIESSVSPLARAAPWQELSFFLVVEEVPGRLEALAGRTNPTLHFRLWELLVHIPVMLLRIARPALITPSIRGSLEHLEIADHLLLVAVCTDFCASKRGRNQCFNVEASPFWFLRRAFIMKHFFSIILPDLQLSWSFLRLLSRSFYHLGCSRRNCQCMPLLNTLLRPPLCSS